ncbi:4'-phosphopantetheinyl transferase family protein [Undibacterium sp. Ren11W]|uniref:4'-phosphopantetheinyl transferase family protein n=1 Tax=Undibacterium sp. Ren11W TaxID=3413045 RepID=UPI003BF0047D
MSALTVYPWPEQSAAACAALAEHALVVLSVITPASASRDFARQQIRLALGNVLSQYSGCPVEQLILERQAGQVPGLKLSIPGHQIAISISHESGLSIAAIAAINHGSRDNFSDRQPDSDKQRAGLGIDLLKIAHLPDWQEVAALYLGPQVSAAIAATPLPQQAACFARHWAQLEAKLKYQGLALSEWSEQSTADVQAYLLQELALPTGYAGAIATSIQAKSE